MIARDLFQLVLWLAIGITLAPLPWPRVVLAFALIIAMSVSDRHWSRT